MSSGLIATTSKPLVQYYELVYIGVNNGYYLTNAPFDISYGGNNYKMAGALLSIDMLFHPDFVPLLTPFTKISKLSPSLLHKRW